jgi:membrane protein
MNANKNIFSTLSELLTLVIRFITYDIWRITENEVSGLKRIYIFIAKSIILAFRGFRREDLQTKASALTYNTLLAIVPLLAVIIGIAGGFGMRDTVRNSIYSYFPGHVSELAQAFDFADNYLSVSQGGFFIGIGLIALLYTVITLISGVENTFNDVWQVKKGRAWRRKITDYLAFIIILPALITLSSGLSLFISTLKNTFLSEYLFITPVANSLLKLAPYLITILFFTVLFMLMPNTKVRFLNALAAAVITGCAFQGFQYVYISGQIWVSKYNAIYGSFAALPLLLLWLQLSWLLILFGAEIAYSSQNVKKFSFETDTKNISRRYRDFLTVIIASLIVKRFETENAQPYTADELSDNNRIPIRLTTDILYQLSELNIIQQIVSDEVSAPAFQPAFDVNKLTVGLLLKKIDEYGSENFKIDKSATFGNEWQTLLKYRDIAFDYGNNLLLKDL